MQADSNHNVPITEQHSQGTSGMFADRLTLELPRTAAAQPAGRSDFGRLHGDTQAFALCPSRQRGHRRDGSPILRPCIYRCGSRQQGGQFLPLRAALRHNLLYRQSGPRTQADERRSQEPDPARARTGRQKPLHHLTRRRPQARRKTHRLGQDSQLRPDLHRTGLHTHRRGCQGQFCGTILPCNQDASR